MEGRKYELVGSLGVISGLWEYLGFGPTATNHLAVVIRAFALDVCLPHALYGSSLWSMACTGSTGYQACDVGGALPAQSLGHEQCGIRYCTRCNFDGLGCIPDIPALSGERDRTIST